MASNIIEVEAAAQRLAVERPRAGILLLDFKAAFPSIAHGYLHEVLSPLGLPQCVRTSVGNPSMTIIRAGLVLVVLFTMGSASVQGYGRGAQSVLYCSLWLLTSY